MQSATVQSESLESPAKIRKVVAVLLGELNVEAGPGIPWDTALSIEIAACIGPINLWRHEDVRPQAIGSKTSFKNPDRSPAPLLIGPALCTKTYQDLLNDLEPCDMSLRHAPGAMSPIEGAVPERAHRVCDKFRGSHRRHFREDVTHHRVTVASGCDTFPTKKSPWGALWGFEH